MQSTEKLNLNEKHSKSVSDLGNNNSIILRGFNTYFQNCEKLEKNLSHFDNQYLLLAVKNTCFARNIVLVYFEIWISFYALTRQKKILLNLALI